ncbi:MAG: SUMF1/EgtB/PvdO family nonheme iron enzyme [Pseudomonadota bacterium]
MLRALSAATALACLALSAATTAAAQDVALCHYDDPAPYLAALEDPERPRGAPPPACAEALSAAEAPAELALPLPCGHNMVFRRVDVGVQDLLDHETVYLGDANANARATINKVSSIPRAAALSGSFFRQEGDGTLVSYYYIAKYELTAAQWRLHDQGLLARPVAETASPDAPVCREHLAWVRDTQRPVNVLPATGLSWFDAVDYARAMTLWLVGFDALLVENGARPLLPWSEGSSGFVRLPSDTEWEYAARGGGANVTREARSRAYYLIERDGESIEPELREIAQIDGLSPPQVMVAGVGKRAPNPLGLYDVLGNAEELVLDLFRPTRPDGLKGQMGAAVVRGGSTQTSDGLIGLGYRQEAPLFDGSGEVRSATVGARLALAAPYFVGGVDETSPYKEGLANEEQFERIEDAVAALGTESARADTGTVPTMEEFLARAQAADLPPEARALIGEAEQLVRQNLAERVQADRDALKERMIAAITLSLGIDRTGANVYSAMQRIHSNLFNEGLSPANRARVVALVPGFLTKIDERTREVNAMFTTYVENVAAILEAPEERRRLALNDATQWAATRDAPRLQQAMGVLTDHLRQVTAGSGAIDERLRSGWLAEIDSFRGDRDKMFADIEREVSQ